MRTLAPHFFMSYSREDAELQRRIAAELRGRGINVWVDVENLIPGSPAWEREVERSIRGAAGLIVLLSPESNNSEWVRREVSFAEHNEKRIFPVLLSGDEDDSIPLRLSNHQHLDLRSHFDARMDELADALHDHLDITKVAQRKKPETNWSSGILSIDLRKLAFPGLIVLIAIACIGALVIAALLIFSSINPSLPTQAVIPTPSTEPLTHPTAQDIGTNEDLTGMIGDTCQVNKTHTFDQICMIHTDGTGQPNSQIHSPATTRMPRSLPIESRSSW